MNGVRRCFEQMQPVVHDAASKISHQRNGADDLRIVDSFLPKAASDDVRDRMR